MLKIVDKRAYSKNLNLRHEIHGEETVPAIDLHCVVTCDADTVGELMPDGADLWDDAGMPRFGEVFPLKLRHKFKNVEAHVRYPGVDITMKGADLAKMKLTPKQDRQAELVVAIQYANAVCAEYVAGLWACCGEYGEIEIEARQHDIGEGEDPGEDADE